MAPENLQGEPYLGEAADVWACGVVLFLMLTGFSPFGIAQESDW
jgi:serine/threonine protein kinase